MGSVVAVTFLRRAASFDLEAAAAGRLERLLHREAERVIKGLDALHVTSPICAIAFAYTADSDIPEVPYDWAQTQRDRLDQAGRDPGPAAASVWSPAGWDLDGFKTPYAEDSWEAAQVVAEDLYRAGCEWVQPAFLLERSWRLSRYEWPTTIPVTDDFAVWAHSLDYPEYAAESFQLSAPPRALHAYAARGWI